MPLLCWHLTSCASLLLFCAGEVTQRGNNENKRDVLDCTENELESVDSVSVCQPQLCP